MAESAETKEYMGRSWRMLTHDKGWYKPLLVLPLAKLVPIAGPLGVWGYQAEWARLSAWGKETYPKQAGVKVGACIKSGWRAFLAMLGYAAIYFILLAAVRPSADGLAALLWDMLKRDFGSIAEIALVLFLGSLLIEGFCILCALIIVVPSLAELGGFFAYSGSAAAIAVLAAHFLARFAPWMVLALYLAAVFATALQTVAVNALGLWFQQFVVPHWGSSKDPLPDSEKKDAETPEEPAQTAAEPQATPAPEDKGASEAAPAPAEEPDKAAEEPEKKGPTGGLPAIGESSAPADEPATLIMRRPEDEDPDER